MRSNPEMMCEAMRNSDGQALQFASEELRGDREYVLGAAQEMGPAVLEHASEELRANREFMMEVVDFCPPGEVLAFMPEALREELLADREFVLQAVQDTGAEVLESVAESLRGRRDFILAVADICPPGEALAYATDALRTELYNDRTFMLQAIRAVGAEVLEDASEELRGDRDFLRQAADCCREGDVLQYASEAIRTEFGVRPLAPGSGSREANSYLAAEPGQAPADGWGQAVGSSSGAQAMATGDTLAADGYGDVRPGPEAATFVAPVVNGFAANPQDGPAAVAGVPAVVLQPVAPLVVEPPSLHVQGARILMAVREMGSQALDYASPELRADKEFIVAAAACCQCQDVLRYGSDKVRAELANDRAFLQKFLREAGAPALEHASLELRGDRDFMLSAAVICPPREALRYASERLRAELCADRAFMLKAVWQVGTPALEHASVDLRGDRDFMFTASYYVSAQDVLTHASDAVRLELAGDRNFMLKALRELGVQALETATPELRKDREFMRAAAACCPRREVQRYADEGFKAELAGDKEFMKQAVWEQGAGVLAQCSPELRGDREFVMVAAAFSPNEALKHALGKAREELSKDRAYMLKAVKEVGAQALACAAEELRSDLGFMLSVASCCKAGEALQYASEDLRAMLEDDDDDDDD